MTRTAVLLALAVMSPTPSLAAEWVTFTPSIQEFANPERGFYVPGTKNLDSLEKNDFEEAFRRGYRLMYVRIDLSPYRTTTLPSAFLERLQEAVNAARGAGIKLIVRAVYNYPKGETTYRQAEDAPLPYVLKHIRALSALFRNDADVIPFVQAGFVGAWGEWHTSSNGLTAAAARRQIRAALLDAVPANRFVQFRYPPYLQAWSPKLPSLEITLRGGFRTGFHNDCFLASDTDVGTYDAAPGRRAIQRAYASRLSELAPFGGETCNPADDAGARPRTECADILADGARFHLTYLNDNYYRPLFHERWALQGCAAEVNRRIGYRFRIVRMALPQEAHAGGRLMWSGVVANDGWARLYNSRSAELVLRRRSSGQVLRLKGETIDPRSWLPGRQSRFEARPILPLETPPGEYDVFFALPDVGPRLHDDTRFAIRPANADVEGRGQAWDSRLGAFSTGQMLRVRRLRP